MATVKRVPNRFRFNDAYEHIYEISNKETEYIYIGSYFAYGITADMTELDKITAVISQS